MTPVLALNGRSCQFFGMVTDRSSGTHFLRLALIAITGCAAAIQGESGTLMSGPMLGYSEYREVLV